MEYVTLFKKNVGILRDDKVFITHREERHIFRKYGGIGMSYSVIDRLRRQGCEKIVILLHKRDGSTVQLQTTPEKFIVNGIFHRDKEADNQRILPFLYLGDPGIDLESLALLDYTAIPHYRPRKKRP